MTTPEARFHSKFYDKLDDFVHSEETPFSAVHIEDQMENGGRADIIVESHLTESLVVEVKRDDKYPLESEFVRQARDYAESKDTRFFAVCNSKDFFLFDYRGEFSVTDIDFHYLNLREADIHNRTFSGIIPKILQAIEFLAENDRLPRQREREQVVGLLRSFHSSVWQTYKALARETYESNAAFTTRLEEWISENDYSGLPDDEKFEVAAKQHAYLLANKILFYDVVREKTPDVIKTRSTNELNSLYKTDNGKKIGVTGIKPRLDRQFKLITDEIDYEPIFDDEGTIFEVFPENKKTQRSIQSLLESIEARRLTNVDEDLLGELYEELIPEKERRELGQFYTPPRVAEAITKWTLQPITDRSDQLPRVLDPASGSGTFPVEIYKTLDAAFPSASHQDLIDTIHVIDINRFPLHLTALNLASRDITKKTDRFHARNSSFFDVSPTEETISAFTDKGKEFTTSFDAVVGNPPYIRQENLYPNKEHFRHHLKAYKTQSGSTLYYDGSKSLSKKSDAYVYFITHALRFLREGGRLGFIIPKKWLDVRYGEKLQQFLFDNVKIEAIVDFRTRVFEDALVDPCLLLVEKCSNENQRSETVTDFIRVKDTMSPTDLVDTVSLNRDVPDSDPFRFENRSGYSIVSFNQGALAERGPRKLGYYLDAPRPLLSIVDSKSLKTLDELDYVDVRRGVMTGATPFFFLSEEDISEWGIDERFLKPSIKSIRNVETVVTPEGGVGLYLLDMSDYVNSAQLNQAEDSQEKLEEYVKSELRKDGYSNVLEYIKWGEREGYNTRQSCKSRKVWFDLGSLHAPTVLHPVFFRERVFTIRNTEHLVPSNAVQCINTDRYHEEVSAVLNSTLHKIMIELWGREEAGIRQMLTYEVKSIPVPDVSEFSEDERAALRDAHEVLLINEENGQTEIDEVLLAAMGLNLSVDDLQQMHSLMVRTRVDGAADTTPLIKELNEYDEYDLDGFVHKDEENSSR